MTKAANLCSLAAPSVQNESAPSTDVQEANRGLARSGAYSDTKQAKDRHDRWEGIVPTLLECRFNDDTRRLDMKAPKRLDRKDRALSPE